MAEPSFVDKIYLIRACDGSLNGYVGWTRKTILARYNSHVMRAKSGEDCHVHRWLRKINFNSEVILLEEVNVADTYSEAEKRWIRHYRNLGWDLKNETDGGEGIPGYRHSNETRARISLNHGKHNLGKHLNEGTRQKLRLALLGKAQSPESNQKRSTTLSERYVTLPHPSKGRKYGDEFKHKMSQAVLGKKNGFFGRSHAKETIELNRKFHLGRPSAMKGRHYSDEQKKQMRLVKEQRRALKVIHFPYTQPDLFTHVVNL